MDATDGAIASSPFEAVLGERPELLERYRAFYLGLWHDGLVSHRILELCRLRIAFVHGAAQEAAMLDASVALSSTEMASLERGDFSRFDKVERAALELCELLPFDHHAISDHQVAGLSEALGAPGCVTLLTALSFFDVTCRLKLLWDLPAETMRMVLPGAVLH